MTKQEMENIIELIENNTSHNEDGYQCINESDLGYLIHDIKQMYEHNKPKKLEELGWTKKVDEEFEEDVTYSRYHKKTKITEKIEYTKFKYSNNEMYFGLEPYGKGYSICLTREEIKALNQIMEDLKWS